MSNLRGNLNGVDGLLLAIIDQALRDYQSGGPHRRSAAAYFSGPIYRHHITALGLPADIVPIALYNGNKRGSGRSGGQLSEQNATQKEREHVKTRQR